jgi:prepilin-type N-terminal cleavage/methylation domain-containing protein
VVVSLDKALKRSVVGVQGDRLKPGRQTRSSLPARGGFTLLEVVLAVTIACGLLMVVLFFYSQAADLRTQLLQESGRIASIRQVMDILSADLRCAHNEAAAGLKLSGDSSSLRLVKVVPLAPAQWTTGPWKRDAAGEADLRRICYSLGATLEGTNAVVNGLVRAEEPCLETRRAARTAQPPLVSLPETAPPPPEPLSEEVRYLHFRYWDGTKWADSWDSTSLPQGIEVTLASEPRDETAEPGEAGQEMFRRVIYLPGSVKDGATSSTAKTDGTSPAAREGLP